MQHRPGSPLVKDHAADRVGSMHALSCFGDIPVCLPPDKKLELFMRKFQCQMCEDSHQEIASS